MDDAAVTCMNQQRLLTSSAETRSLPKECIHQNLTHVFISLNTTLLRCLNSCYINACPAFQWNSNNNSWNQVKQQEKLAWVFAIGHLANSRYGPAEWFSSTFPFLSHTLILDALLYLHSPPLPPFLLPSSRLTLRCKCLAPPVALAESCSSKTRFSSLMHQRGAAAGLPSRADKCARTDEAAINSHYRHRLRLRHGTVYFSESYFCFCCQFQSCKSSIAAKASEHLTLKNRLIFQKRPATTASYIRAVKNLRRIVAGETRLCINMSVSHKKAKAAELPGTLTQLMLKPKLWFCCEEASFHFQHSFVQPVSSRSAIVLSQAACNLQALKGLYGIRPMKE